MSDAKEPGTFKVTGDPITRPDTRSPTAHRSPRPRKKSLAHLEPAGPIAEDQPGFDASLRASHARLTEIIDVVSAKAYEVATRNTSTVLEETQSFARAAAILFNVRGAPSLKPDPDQQSNPLRRAQDRFAVILARRTAALGRMAKSGVSTDLPTDTLKAAELLRVLASNLVGEPDPLERRPEESDDDFAARLEAMRA